MGHRTTLPYTWNGIVYDSIKEAARQLGVTVVTLQWRKSKGYTKDSDLTPPNRRNPKMKPCTWNGIEYESISDAARANFVNEVTMLNRVNAGYTCDDDVWKARATPCTWNGVEYESIKAAAAATWVTPGAMSVRVARGLKADDDLVYGAKACTWNGVEYRSILQAARAAGVHPNTMSRWIRSGFTCDAERDAADAANK